MNLRSVALGLIRLYKVLISPFLPVACRFWPTCSEYSYQAIKTHGLPRGLWLSIKRLCRCHPFNRGGYDPVVPTSSAPQPELPKKAREPRELRWEPDTALVRS